MFSACFPIPSKQHINGEKKESWGKGVGGEKRLNVWKCNASKLNKIPLYPMPEEFLHDLLFVLSKLDFKDRGGCLLSVI